MQEMDEQRIIERCQDGDKAAFRMVVEKYQRMLFPVALRMMCNEEAAKDVVQETFIRAWLNIKSFDKRKSLRNWLYTIAVRRCLDTSERVSRKAAVAVDESLLRAFVSEQTPEKRLENSELAAVINALTDRLSPKQRAVFTLVCLEGLDTSEVEAITGLDAARIKGNLHIARKKIREQLKQLGYER